LLLLVAGLNGLDIHLTDIRNAYLTAPVTKSYYVVAGNKFGPNFRGRLLKIVRALIGSSQLEQHFERAWRRCLVAEATWTLMMMALTRMVVVRSQKLERKSGH
jgi:hypothetical protein